MQHKHHPWIQMFNAGVEHVYPVDVAASLKAAPSAGMPVCSPLKQCPLCEISHCEQLLIGEAIVHEPTPELRRKKK